MNSKNVYAILVAGGTGTRMGTAIPKQFLPINDKPVLYYATKAFLDAFPNIKLILVLPQAYLSYSNILLQAFDASIDLTIVTGGETRFHSVQNGLREVEDGSIVFIHDAVRPMITPELLQRCYQGAREKGSAIPAVPVIDSTRLWNGSNYVPVNRDALRSIQTPQTFDSTIIKKAFEQEYKSEFTDEATVLEAMEYQINLVEGLRQNIKITTPEDLVIATAIFNQQMIETNS